MIEGMERIDAINIVLGVYRENLEEAEAAIRMMDGVVMDCNYVLGYNLVDENELLGLFARFRDDGGLAIGGIVGAARMNYDEALAMAPMIRDFNGENPVPVRYMPALRAYRDEMVRMVAEMEEMLVVA